MNPFFESEHLEGLLAKQLTSNNGVGMAVLIMQEGNVLATASAGERKVRSAVPITSQDKWHVGSISKSMTATMLARLVKQGLLSWETKIAEVFAGASGLNPLWQRVSLRNLLDHSSGSPANFPLRILLKNPKAGEARRTARSKATALILAKPPMTLPNFMFRYSNVGYTLAGVMAEQLSGLTWEELIEREIFGPLGLHSAGFGTPKEGGEHVGQPWGHGKILGWRYGSRQDNSPVMGPAGAIHMNLLDLCAFGNEHVRGLNGKGDLLAADAYEELHRPGLGQYACGWIVDAGFDDVNHRVEWHDGSNTFWYVTLALVPELELVAAIAYNDGFKMEQKGDFIRNFLQRVIEALSH